MILLRSCRSVVIRRGNSVCHRCYLASSNCRQQSQAAQTILSQHGDPVTHHVGDHNVNNDAGTNIQQDQGNIRLYDNIEQLLGSPPNPEEELVERQHYAHFPHSSKLSPLTYGYDPYDGAFYPRAGITNGGPHPQESLTLTLTTLEVRRVKGIHDMRRLLRRSFRECNSVRDVLKMLAICMQREHLLREFLKLPHALYSALYRTRDHSSDIRIAGLVLTIIQRLETRGYPPEEWMLQLCLKFAARGRNLRIMNRALWTWRKSGFTMTSTLFRSIIAKFSIGRRGWGEIRNGRWRRSELTQVLFGFTEVRSGPLYHLELWLDRDDWHFLHGWIMLLARCRAVDKIEKEWRTWLGSESRRTGCVHHRTWSMSERQRIYRFRGDKWFIRHMLIAGDAKRAWLMVREAEMQYMDLSPPVRNVLLENLEHVPAGFWGEDMRRDLMNKYEEDLTLIESRLGVEWVADEATGRGWHTTQNNLPETLEELSRPDYFRVYGYITDSDTAEKEVFSVGDRLGKPMISDYDTPR